MQLLCPRHCYTTGAVGEKLADTKPRKSVVFEHNRLERYPKEERIKSPKKAFRTALIRCGLFVRKICDLILRCN